MITKHIFNTVLTITTILSMLGCRVDNSSPYSKDGKNNKDGIQPSTTACYLSQCYETMLISDIDSSKADYVYPNPDEFRDVNMRPQYKPPTHIIDLKDTNPNTKVSDNFKLKDFMSTAKGRFGLYSSEVATIMQLIRNEVRVPVYVNSGYRSPGYNKRIDGAAKWSRHTYGDAVDFRIQNKSISATPDYCKKHGASFTLTYENHVHCDWRKKRLDPAFYPTQDPKFIPDEDYDYATLVAQNSKIIFRKIGNRIEFDSLIALEEDEGRPTYKWTITLPSGETMVSETTTFMVPAQKGKYDVQLVVGGSIILNEEVTW